MDFEIHENFSTKIFLADLPLCRVFLENEKHYPWLLLVPRRPQVLKMMDLSIEDQQQLLHEMDFAQRLLWDTFNPAQLNVAAIGNRTPQLHVHVIARYTDDPAWPGTVWDHPARASYAADQLNHIAAQLKSLLLDVDKIGPIGHIGHIQ